MAFNLFLGWTECDSPCDGGKALRYRNCSNPLPKNGGVTCNGDPVEIKLCNTESCDGVCTTPFVYDSCVSQRCPLSCSDLQEGYGCNIDDECVGGCRCPEGYLEDYGGCRPISECNCIDKDNNIYLPGPMELADDCRQCTCLDGRLQCEERNCSIDCTWSSWSVWSGCSTSCNNGTRTRFRCPSNPAVSGGGKLCEGETEETLPCFLTECPDVCVIDDVEYEDGQIVSADDCNECRCINNTKVCIEYECAGMTSAPQPCTLATITRNITKENGCSRDNVEIQICLGACHSSTKPIPEYPYFMSDCPCCNGILREDGMFGTLVLMCPDGSTREEAFPLFNGCRCSSCFDETQREYLESSEEEIV
ncbi:SCO-spondin-like [Saccoglossus kowalevskii]